MKKTLFEKLDSFIDTTTENYEIETTLFGRDMSIRYYEGIDEIVVILWNEFHGDVHSFIDTDNFDSFDEYADDHCEYFEDHWDYANESVYQTYHKMTFRQFMENDGTDTLQEFVFDQLERTGIKLIKRPILERINRKCQEINYYLKNLLK